MYMIDDDVPRDLLRKYEIALSKIDEVIQTIAAMTQGKVSVHDHGTPVRSVEYLDDKGIGKRILVEPADLDQNPDQFTPVFNLHLEAWRDEGTNQLTWHKRQLRIVDFPAEYTAQLELFEQCLVELKNVKPMDLK